MSRTDDAGRASGMDRRRFLGTVGAAAGIAAAAAVSPASARALGVPYADAGAADRSIGDATREAAAAPGEILADWDIDDQWGHAPRYAHPIPYSPARTAPVEWEHVDPIDRLLVI